MSSIINNMSILNIICFVILSLIIIYICCNVKSIFCFILCLTIIIILFYIFVLNKGDIINTYINSTFEIIFKNLFKH